MTIFLSLDLAPPPPLRSLPLVSKHRKNTEAHVLFLFLSLSSISVEVRLLPIVPKATFSCYSKRSENYAKTAPCFTSRFEILNAIVTTVGGMMLKG
jgi:hypothetical protein